MLLLVFAAVFSDMQAYWPQKCQIKNKVACMSLLEGLT